MIGIDVDLDGLYDPQQAKPAGRCACCGAEVWLPERELCGRCEKMQNAKCKMQN